MFPQFEIFGVVVYTFGLTLTLSFFLFLWMLKKLSNRNRLNLSFFTNNIIRYFFSVFFFSRLFYVISNWNDLKYIRNTFDFIIMSDYYFSLAGAFFGFFLVLFFHIKTLKLKLRDYIDTFVISFLFISFIAYIGAFLGGQVFGRDTTLGIEVLYSNPFSQVPYVVPIFPLAIVYSVLSFILFSATYILSLFIKIRGLLGYSAFIIYSSIILIFEFFTGRYDTIKDTFGVNLIQIFSLISIMVFGYLLIRLLKEEGHETQIMKNDLTE